MLSMLRSLGMIFFGVLLVPLGTTRADVSPLGAADFKDLHQSLKPSEDEAWRRIPWKISLLAAQRQAVEEGKPLFIWAMDGHPLGCT